MQQLTIIWEPVALENLDRIVRYIARRWSTTEVDRYLQAINEREQVLARNPEAFQLIKPDEGIRKTVVNKRTVIFYQVSDELQEVQILSVFDTREDPEKHF